MSEIACKDASAVGICNLQYGKKMFYHVVLFFSTTLLAKESVYI